MTKTKFFYFTLNEMSKLSMIHFKSKRHNYKICWLVQTCNLFLYCVTIVAKNKGKLCDYLCFLVQLLHYYALIKVSLLMVSWLFSEGKFLIEVRLVEYYYNYILGDSRKFPQVAFRIFKGEGGYLNWKSKGVGALTV